MKKLLWLLPAALLIAASIFIVPCSISAQDNLNVENLQIDPKSAKESDNITITADVTNTSTDNATYTLELKVNDEIKDTQKVTLAAKKSQTVSFTIIAGKPGDYIVDLNGVSDYFTVKSSFMAMFPPYLWVIIGAIVGVLILFIIVLVAMPSRKKQAGRADKTMGKAARSIPPPMTGQAMNQGFMPGPSPMGQTGMPPQMQSPMQMSMPSPMQPPMQQPMRPMQQIQPPMQRPMQQMAPPPFQTPFPTPGPMAAQHPPHAGRPMFQLRNLTITPTQLKQGDSVTISAIVANNGTEHGRYSVVLRIGGIVEGITEVDLAAGTSQAVVFTVTKEEPGTYYVEVDGLAGSFLIIALVPAHFNVGNLAVTPDRVNQGESITVSAIVTNAGEIAGSHSLVLKIKGAVEAVEEVHLSPGASQRVAFNVVKNTPGFYQVDLEGLAGRFVVEMEWRG